MSVESRGFRRLTAWLAWVVATTAGWAIGLPVALSLSNAFDLPGKVPLSLPIGFSTSINGAWIGNLAAGALLGIFVSVAQRSALGYWAEKARWWFGPTIFGMAIAFTISTSGGLPFLDGESPLGIALTGFLGGLILGVFQRLPLRRWVRGSLWWIPATAVGWAIVTYSLGSIPFATWMFAARHLSAIQARLWRELAIGAVSGASIGVITGFVLVMLSAHVQRQHDKLLTKRMSSSAMDSYRREGTDISDL